MSALLALIIDVLAPSFGGQKDFVASLKLVAYSSTVVWLAGIFHLIGSFAKLADVGRRALRDLHVLPGRAGPAQMHGGQGDPVHADRRCSCAIGVYFIAWLRDGHAPPF